jgi:transcription elongation factor GreA
MEKHFTRQGLDLKQRQLKLQEDQEAGQEAGINCDWHDNFGYEDAKRRLELESSILAALRDEVAGARIISIEEQSETVKIGVTVQILLGGDERSYTIGAFGESAPSSGLISYTSPLGRILFGMHPGDTKRAQLGGKNVEIELVRIYPPSYRYHDLIALLMASAAASSQSR